MVPIRSLVHKTITANLKFSYQTADEQPDLGLENMQVAMTVKLNSQFPFSEKNNNKKMVKPTDSLLDFLFYMVGYGQNKSIYSLLSIPRISRD